MYNLNGILYRIVCVGGVILLIGVLLLVISRFWIPQKVNIAVRNTSVIIIIISALYIFFHVYKFNNPQILCHEGFLSREYRDSTVAPPLPLTYAYVFTNSDGLKPTFYLDTFTAKDVFNYDMEVQTKYRIYYEKDLKIIVRVEEIVG